MGMQDSVPASGGFAPSAEPADASEALLEVSELSIGYGQRRILADLRFDLPARGLTVLMGPGGAGKSTLLYWLSGLPASGRRFDSGAVRYLGRPIEEAASRPALVQQKAQLLMGRLGDMLSASLRPHLQATPAQLRQAVAERMQSLGLDTLVASLDHVVADLPAADIRIASILQAAFTRSELLLIDEPTHGLVEADAERVLAVIERIARTHACLVSTHNQRHARRLAERVLLLAGGRIQVDASADDFFANRAGHPVLAQFLRTGSCSVPGLDARPEHLDAAFAGSADDACAASPEAPVADAVGEADTAAPPVVEAVTAPAEAPVAAACTDASASTSATAPDDAPVDEEPAALSPTNSEFPPRLEAPPSSHGPTGFRWLVRGRIAGCAKPGVVSPMDHDLALLKRMGITLLINLTEHDFPADALRRHGLKGFAVKIEDRRAPPLLWAKLLLAKMERFLRDGETIAVHCLAGLGRTGTVLCAWLIREGLTAEEALRRLRAIDPGFVQSREQEDLLVELENNLLIRTR